MFTEETYREYFLAMHRKKKEELDLLRFLLKQVQNDTVRDALAWHLEQNMRAVFLVEELITSVSPRSKEKAIENIKFSRNEQLVDDKLVEKLASTR